MKLLVIISFAVAAILLLGGWVWMQSRRPDNHDSALNLPSAMYEKPGIELTEEQRKKEEEPFTDYSETNSTT